jgi:general stress protein 26
MSTYLETKTVTDLIKRIEQIEICMFNTVEPSGKIVSRPMATRQIDPDGTLWFFTDEHSDKVDELEAFENINLAYSDISKQNYVSVSGSGELVTDRTIIEKLWSPVLQAWFPKGLDDPNLALIKVIPHTAEYWDASSSKVKQFIDIAKAIIKGKQYQGGSHGKVNM